MLCNGCRIRCASRSLQSTEIPIVCVLVCVYVAAERETVQRITNLSIHCGNCICMKLGARYSEHTWCRTSGAGPGIKNTHRIHHTAHTGTCDAPKVVTAVEPNTPHRNTKDLEHGNVHVACQSYWNLCKCAHLWDDLRLVIKCIWFWLRCEFLFLMCTAEWSLAVPLLPSGRKMCV